ncbi:GDSL-type esterase/lipase family protein [Microbacterium sp. BWT-B31]|uniref:GDSL-type esterase/lipase family protein n=1 Tax=Microbacterium sp. BWT-B31 TaxID=3232072 RepID=UPI0035281EC5
MIVSGTDWDKFINGAASLEPHPDGGFEVHRLPTWARAQFQDPLFTLVEACPTGVIIRLRTDAPSLNLTMGATTTALVGTDPAPVSLVVRQDGAESIVTLTSPSMIFFGTDYSIVDTRLRGPETVAIPSPGTGPVEVFLPHNAQVRLISMQAQESISPVRNEGIRWTHYGSSISHGMNAVAPTRTWPMTAADHLGWELRNLSFGGNAQLDGFVARMIRDIPADVITLKVGINLINADSMRERTFRPAVHAFLDTIREGQPSTPIVIISAVACPIHENSPGPVTRDTEGMARAASRAVERDTGALTLIRTREILAEIVGARADEHLHLLDGLDLFGEDDTTLLYDRLHPDQEGLDLIARRFADNAIAHAEEWGTPSSNTPRTERTA